MSQKSCVKCLNFFSGRRCPVCRAKYLREWTIANKEKVKAASEKYRKNNREKANLASANWAMENKERVIANNKNYREKNPEKRKESCKLWVAKNPEALKLFKHARRAREKQVGGVLSIGLVEKLFKLQRGKCPCCHLPLGDSYHLDHKMPLALGGTNTDDNMQLLRQRCNQQKSAKHPVDFMQQRGFLL